jgi:hypothetical protein
VVVAGPKLPRLSVLCRVGSGVAGRFLKVQRRHRGEGGQQDVVVANSAVWLVKADLCSPGWLCRGVAAGLA